MEFKEEGKFIKDVLSETMLSFANFFVEIPVTAMEDRRLLPTRTSWLVIMEDGIIQLLRK